MDVIIGLLFAGLVIGVSAAAGASLERTRRRRTAAGADDARAGAEPYGDF